MFLCSVFVIQITFFFNYLFKFKHGEREPIHALFPVIILFFLILQYVTMDISLYYNLS